MNIRLAIYSCLLLTLANAWLPAQAQEPSGANSLTGKIGACRQISNASERLICFDALADKLQQTTPSATIHRTGRQKLMQPEQSTSTSVTQAEELFGKSETERREILEKERGAETTTSLTAGISKVVRNHRGQLIISLDNGQRWQQTDDRRYLLSSGDNVIITEGIFGGYQLRKTDASRTIRVRRSD
ncbi:MAG: hypothetical protein KDI36_19305 [Pseudomonadales bacterium]|nr:hypothetical protein [Pseudomonadales bacterium]